MKLTFLELEVILESENSLQLCFRIAVSNTLLNGINIVSKWTNTDSTVIQT